MKLIELKIRNFGCIDEKGITIKIDNIVVLIGPNEMTKQYINWYNYVRSHSTNNYMTPMEVRYRA